MSTTLTLAGRRVDARRRTLLRVRQARHLRSSAAAEAMADRDDGPEWGNAPFVDPAQALRSSAACPSCSRTPGIVDGSGGRQFSLTVGRRQFAALSGVNTPIAGL